MRRRSAPFLVALVALAARLAPVLAGGGVTGILAYDDGVYYASGDALLSGRLPYRDYVLLHPPGIVLVLAPFAAIGRLVGEDQVGLAVARIAFMLVGAASSVLVWAVARRVSERAGLGAGLLYAVWQPASHVERTTMLEPLVSLGLLAALALLAGPTAARDRRRTVLAGVALGLAVVVKAWALVPFGVVAFWVLRRAGVRRAATFSAAGAAAALVVALPFLVTAGPQLVRMVVLDQLGRPDNGVPVLYRLASIEALPVSRSAIHTPPAAVVLAVTAAGLAAAAVVARRVPAARLWLALLVAQGAVLLAAPSYFGHYSAFAAPALALLAGAGAELVAGTVAAYAPALRPTAALAGLAVLAVLSWHVVSRPEGRHVPAAAAEASLTGVRCVAADSAAALVAQDVLTRDLDDGCPVVVDVTGLTYDQDPGDLRPGPTPTARRHDPEWQRQVARYFRGSGAVLLDQWHSDGLDGRLLTTLERRDQVVGTRTYQVLLPAS